MEKSPKYVFKVVVVGDSGVGKTSIFGRMLRNEFSKEARSTLAMEFGMKTLQVDNTAVRLQLWDTAGTP